MIQNSHLVLPAADHNTTGEVDLAFHGYGPLKISVAGFPTEIDPLVLDTSVEPDSEFPYNEDINSGASVGLSMRTISKNPCVCVHLGPYHMGRCQRDLPAQHLHEGHHTCCYVQLAPELWHQLHDPLHCQHRPRQCRSRYKGVLHPELNVRVLFHLCLLLHSLQLSDI